SSCLRIQEATSPRLPLRGPRANHFRQLRNDNPHPNDRRQATIRSARSPQFSSTSIRDDDWPLGNCHRLRRRLPKIDCGDEIAHRRGERLPLRRRLELMHHAVHVGPRLRCLTSRGFTDSRDVPLVSLKNFTLPVTLTCSLRIPMCELLDRAAFRIRAQRRVWNPYFPVLGILDSAPRSARSRNNERSSCEELCSLSPPVRDERFGRVTGRRRRQSQMKTVGVNGGRSFARPACAGERGAGNGAVQTRVTRKPPLWGNHNLYF